MREHDVRWKQYPAVADDAAARAWLAMQAGRNLARHTVETYGRSIEDFLRFAAQEGIRPEEATREHLAAYVRDLLARRNPRQPKVVHLDSGAGLANATILLRLSVVRLFFDHLVEEGIRTTNPAGRVQWRRRYGRTPGDPPLIRRHRRLPWIPTEEQWRALLCVMQKTPVRTRLMFALSYDAALRRQELVTLDTTDIDPAHRLIRIRAEHAKNRCERVVPYSVPQLYTLYLQERRAISRARGPPFLSVSNRNAGRALSIWSWSKIVAGVARVSGVLRFTTHTLCHLCLTDLARAGWDIHEIATFAGHRSLTSTLLYIHVSGRELSSKLATTTAAAAHLARAAPRGGAVMKAATARMARNQPPLPTWQWPIDLSAYDQRPRLLRREAAALARRAHIPTEWESPRLEDITLEALATLRQTIASSHASLRGSLRQLSRALVGLGILAEPLNPWAMNGESTTTWPGRGRVPRHSTHGAEEMPIAPEWTTSVERWCATSTLSPKARRAYASQLLMVGRWATATYGVAGAPARGRATRPPPPSR